jgi:hypothetical protein
LRTRERFRVQPESDGTGKQDGDDVARDEHSEAGSNPRCVPPKCQGPAVSQGRATLETGIGENARLGRLRYG